MAKSNNTLALFGGLLLTGLVVFGLRRKQTGSGSAPGARNNAEHLKQLHPAHRDKFERFIRLLERAGYKPQINSSYRTFAKQAQLKKVDSRNATPGYSAHNYGLALDVQLNKNGKTYGMKTPAKDWIETGIIKAAENLGLTWGGTIPGYYDPVHFQVKGIDTTQLYKLALKQFKTSDPSKIQGNAVKMA